MFSVEKRVGAVVVVRVVGRKWWQYGGRWGEIVAVRWRLQMVLKGLDGRGSRPSQPWRVGTRRVWGLSIVDHEFVTFNICNQNLKSFKKAVVGRWGAQGAVGSVGGLVGFSEGVSGRLNNVPLFDNYYSIRSYIYYCCNNINCS